MTAARAASHTRTAAARRTPTLRAASQLLLAFVTLVAATAGGALLLTVAENGTSSLHTLVIDIAIPSAIVIAAAAAAAVMVGAWSMAKGILLGLAFGALSTAGLELVRNIGFYEFNSMPGQLPELMGVLITNRIMDGPDLASNLIGWADHVWNGAAFGVIYAVIVGGFPRRRSHWVGAAMGAAYGLALGTGFLLSPVSRATGAGIFGSIFGAKYVIRGQGSVDEEGTRWTPADIPPFPPGARPGGIAGRGQRVQRA